MPPAGKQPAGDDWLRIQISMSCANFWYSPPLKFVPWDVKQTNKVTVFDIGQGTSFLCGRILQNSARLYEIVSESISIHPGRNSKIVAPDSGKATTRWQYSSCRALPAGNINQNPGRNSKIVAPGFGKATIYDFECRSWLPPAGKQPAGAGKATKTPAETYK